jgi:hypothetical protein
MTIPYSQDKVVVAYDGERGELQFGSDDSPHPGYRNSAQTLFVVNGNYKGAGYPIYLNYDGHPGIDYKAASGTPVYATADGVVHYPSNIPGLSDALRYHTMAIDHGNGYVTYFLHCLTHPSTGNAVLPEGAAIRRGELAAYSGDAGVPGAPHLHVEIHRNGVPVDPYGWQGSYPDPYTAAASVNLWDTGGASPVLVLAPTDPPIQPPTAGSLSFSVTNASVGTMNYTASVTSGSSWLSITSGGSGGNSETIIASYAANNTGMLRSGTIKVTAIGASGSPITVNVTQATSATTGAAFGKKVIWIHNLSNAIDSAFAETGGAVTNKETLLDFIKSKGFDGVIVKAGEGNHLYPDSSPFSMSFVNLCHQKGLKVYGFHYIYGGAYDAPWGEFTTVAGEISVADQILATGCDGLIIDWETEFRDVGGDRGATAVQSAQQYGQSIRALYPNAFIAHAPIWYPQAHYPVIYQTFNMFCDAAMPQAYSAVGSGSTAVQNATGAKMAADMDAAWKQVYAGWPAAAIKPIYPIIWSAGKDTDSTTFTTTAQISEFVQTLKGLSSPASPGGYQGVSFWNSELQTAAIWDGLASVNINEVTPTTITVRVQSNPAGRSFSVDGMTYTTAQTLNWIPGSAHTIATTNPQSAEASAQYIWSSWSDGLGITHTVAPSDNTTYTANFTKQASATVQFGALNFTSGEDAGAAVITVTRDGDTSKSASVDFTTVDNSAAVPCDTVNGTAYARCDYATTTQTLNFAPGETSKKVMLPIMNDSYVEGTETTQLRIQNAVGAALGTQNTATAIIVDNDTAQSATNPLDNADAQFYVRQQYYDFLNREPDASGLQFWTGSITTCGSNVGCVEVKRMNASAAFFLSIEFQETGYLVYRIHKTAFGDLPGKPVPLRMHEFLTDTQEIGRDVQVNVGNWQQQLEANKNAFAAEFVARTQFTSLYPLAMTPSQFVDTLYANAGVTPSASERQAALDEFGGAAATGDAAARARALRRVAENAVLARQEFNKAFVLMQYFGYLRRNPDDAPDSDFGGYQFWLTKLNQFGGNFVQAEMVKAFISSTEYRQRFGQP